MFYKKTLKELHDNEPCLTNGDKLIIEKLIDNGVKVDDILLQDDIKYTGAMLKSEITSYAERYKEIKNKQKVLKCIIGGLTGGIIVICHNKSAIGKKLNKMHDSCVCLKDNFDVVKESFNGSDEEDDD